MAGLVVIDLAISSLASSTACRRHTNYAERLTSLIVVFEPAISA